MTPSKPTTLSHYELLGVSYYASADDVRNGCERALAALDRMRPDGVENDLPEHAVKRRAIMTAYLTLKDGVRRNAYNATLAAASAQRAAAESASAREREDNAGWIAPGWGQAVASPGKSAAPSSQASTLASARAHVVDSSPILREAPVDLRVAAQVRDAERIGQRAARGGDTDGAQWADDATLGVRYVAMTLDTMLVFILLALVAAVRGFLYANATPWYLTSSTKLLLIASALTVLYYAWGECGRHRATLGKRLMGLQVVRLDGVTGVGVLRAVARYGLRLVGSYVLMIGYLMAFFTDRKQALHDKLTTQIARALRHELCHESPHADCEKMAQPKALELLRRLSEVRKTLEIDVEAAFRGDPAARSHHEIIFCYPGLEAITVYRVAHELHGLGVPFIPRMMTELAHAKTGIDIHPGATIGPGFFIDHGTGVVIGET